jgi:hypothetical protein
LPKLAKTIGKHLGSYSTRKREIVSNGENLNTGWTYYVEVDGRANDPLNRVHPTLVTILPFYSSCCESCDGLMLLRRAEVVFNMVGTAATST